MLIACLTISSHGLFAQATTPGNFPAFGTDYLGWDATTTQDLNIRHDGPYPIVFSTNQSERMRLTEDGLLLVGLSTPVAPIGRLQVYSQNTTAAISGRSSATGGTTSIGGYFRASGSTVAIGARGQTILTTTANAAYGVYGEACGATINYGVYGHACEANDSWAGYFNGKTFCPDGVWTASDVQLKTSISAIENASEMLMAIHPKSYEFVQDVPGLNLPEGLQYGVLSQELAEVVPHAVKEFSSPPVLDDEGNILHESEKYQGVNYTQLIPLLIAGFKEQQISQTQYEANQAKALEKLVQLQDELKQLNHNPDIRKDGFGSNRAILQQNTPNPFAQFTDVQYELPSEGRATLEIVDASGRSLKVLADGHHQSGMHRVEWDASPYSSGIYYCILRYEDQLVTIKLIKK